MTRPRPTRRTWPLTLALAAFWAGLVAVLAAPVAATALDFPTRPITLIVPFAAGGSTDSLGRLLARGLERAGGKTVVVENVAGAGATLGAGRAAAASADGYTLLLGSSTLLAIAPHLYPNLKYDPFTSFEPIGEVASSSYVLVTRTGAGPQTYEQLVAYARKNPDKLNFGSPGQGSSPHLTIELMMESSGMTAQHIPFSGTAPAWNALLGGNIDFLVDSPSGALPMVQSGKATALAVTSRARDPALPQVPTLRELGLRDFETLAWFSLLAPKGTPAPVLVALQRMLGKALQDPETQRALAATGFVPGSDSPALLAPQIRREYDRWGAVIKAHNIRLGN